MNFQIKSRHERVLFSCEADSLKAAVENAVEQRTYLGGANLEGADLEGAYLEGADLVGANLEGANLEGADLEGAYLGRANLVGADLGGANLEGAYLGGANLVGAYLGGANLEGADLVGANLGGARGLSAAPPWLIQGSRDPIQHVTAGVLTIRCEEHSIDWWLNNARQMGEKNGYSPEQINEYLGYIKLCKAADEKRNREATA